MSKMQLNAATAFKLILFFVLLIILGQMLWRMYETEMNFREQGEGCVKEGGEVRTEGCGDMRLKYAFVAPEGIVHFCCVLE